MSNEFPTLYMRAFTGTLDLIVDTTNGEQEKAEMLKQIVDFWFASKRKQKNPYQEIVRLSDG